MSVNKFFKNQQVYLAADVEDRETLSKELLKHGAKLISRPGRKNCFHVFESFKGQTYEDLKSKNFDVIGTLCVFDSIRLGSPLPQTQHPVFSRTLQGCKVYCSQAVAKDMGLTMKSLVEFMNGTYTTEFTVDTTHLLANEVASLEYQMAVELKIPVVIPSWLLSCWKSRSLVNPQSYLLPPLTGCMISVTGLSPLTRRKIQRLVTASGAKYSQDLSRKCTHLIAKSPTGNKYRSALEWGVYIVTHDWLLDSVNARVCLDTSQYLVPLLSELPPGALNEIPPESPLNSPWARLPVSGKAGGPMYKPLPTAFRASLIPTRKPTMPMVRPTASPMAAIRTILTTRSQQQNSPFLSALRDFQRIPMTLPPVNPPTSPQSPQKKPTTFLVPLPKNLSKVQDEQDTVKYFSTPEFIDELEALLRGCDSVIEKFESEQQQPTSVYSPPHKITADENVNDLELEFDTLPKNFETHSMDLDSPPTVAEQELTHSEDVEQDKQQSEDHRSNETRNDDEENL